MLLELFVSKSSAYIHNELFYVLTFLIIIISAVFIPLNHLLMLKIYGYLALTLRNII